MSKTLATRNVAAVLLALGIVAGAALTFVGTAKADALSDLQNQVKTLLAQIATLQGGSSSSTTSMSAGFTFTMNAKLGSTNSDVMQIQKFLNSHGFVIAQSGAGSIGNETTYFGKATKKAVAAFQKANGITPASGYWGSKTRAVANSMMAMTTTGGTTGTTGGTTTGTTTTTTGTTTTVVATGPGITVAAGTQPANNIAPKGAMRVAFTTFTLTNNSSSTVTINGVNILRAGPAQDSDFASIALIDQNGFQLGNTQTLDANHSAVVGGSFNLNPGQTATYQVVGNISSTITSGGDVASLTVTGVQTSVPVAGSLPIAGSSQTTNATLTIGSVTMGYGTYDPQGNQNKNIGNTGVKVTGVRFTAGSGEDIKLYSLRWRINGSASATDVSNVVTVVNGTNYPTTVSADGRYFNTSFAGGVLIQKGNSLDVFVQADLTGSNSAGRYLELDLDKATDVYFSGQQYGYGVGFNTSSTGTYNNPSANSHGSAYNTASQPIYQGSTVQIQAGTVTTIQNATNVPSQNIAVNVPNQVLGGFTTNFAGEPVSVSGLTLNMGTTSATAAPITGVTIVDQNGNVVAGPVDMTTSSAVVSFTNSITFPIGAMTYTVKGKLASTAGVGWVNGSTVQVGTSPSGTGTITIGSLTSQTPAGWTSPTGKVTGNTITLTTNAFTLNTMTVRAAAFTVTAGVTPAAQNVVAGGQNVLLGTIQLDASQSGEDIRLSSLPVSFNVGGSATLGNLSGVQVYSAASSTIPLNTGSNVLNSVVASSTLTFDNALTIPKGTVVTLNVQGNVSSAATTGTYQTGVSSAAVTGTGAQSGNSVTATVTQSNSGVLTLTSGASLTVNIDASSPSYAVTAAGSTGVLQGVVKFRSANEPFNLTKLGLTLNGTYGTKATGSGGSSTGPNDLMTVYLYNTSGTLLGTAYFTGTNTTATSTLSTPFLIPRDTDTQIVVRADLAGIGVSASGGIGDLIKVDPLNFEGTGVQSGQTVRGGATAGVAGVRLFKSYPTLALDSLPSTGMADGRLIHFKVSANSNGPVGISQFKFTLATTTASITNVALYGFTDSGYSQPITSGASNGGQIGSTISGISTAAFAMAPTVSSAIEVPANSTYYFELRGSASGVASGASVVATLSGDAAYPTTLVSGYNVATSTNVTSSTNFVWSGNSTTTSSYVTDIDWSDGYSIPGLPSSGLIQTRSN